MSTTKKELHDLEVVMLHEKEEVFSGSLEDFSDTAEKKQTIDRVNIFNNKGSQIVSMNYDDFETIVKEVD